MIEGCRMLLESIRIGVWLEVVSRMYDMSMLEIKLLDVWRISNGIRLCRLSPGRDNDCRLVVWHQERLP